ncbi:hypothetical protein BXZ70DRAFT_342225 [Cristinia sonorae]|uniref:C2 domain-containing protein n=1 Tax=Cristinia sonorae TaxID=1940300 RepID=A0A8K0UKY0_9AGAR|nr:hypothetical protein BXZ70DRAFT_342225 [Cristinia sonorae]
MSVYSGYIPPESSDDSDSESTLQTPASPVLPLNVPRTGIIVVELTVISALNLPLTRFRVKLPNPRLTVFSADGTPPSWQTATVHRSRNPAWNETIQLTLHGSTEVRIQVAHNSNLPTYEYVLGEAIFDFKTIHPKNTEVLQLPLRPVDVPISEYGTCGSVVISARRMTVKRVHSNPVECVTPPLNRSSPRGSFMKSMVGGSLSVPDTDAAQALHRILVRVEKLDNMDLGSQVQSVVSVPYPTIALTCTIVSSLLMGLREQIARDTKTTELLKEIAEVYHFVDDLTDPKVVNALRYILVRILKQTIDSALFLQEYYGFGFIGGCALRQQADASKKLKAHLECFKAFHRAFRRNVTVTDRFPMTSSFSSCEIDDMKMLVRDQYISKLNPVEMDTAHRSVCQPHQSLDVLQDIARWAVDSSDKKNVYWLSGEEKSGKSTLATTVADFFRDISRLGAFVFFEAASSSRNNPTMLFRTITSQLSSYRPSIGEVIAQAIKETPSIGQAGLAQQFSELILRPLLQESLRHEGPLVIIIDGLNECRPMTSRATLLSTLAKELVNLPSFVRIVITSRPDEEICSVFEGCRNVHRRTVDLDEWEKECLLFH